MKREITQIISLVEREIMSTKKVVGDFFTFEEGEGFYVSFKKELTKLSITILNGKYDYLEITKEQTNIQSPKSRISHKIMRCVF